MENKTIVRQIVKKEETPLFYKIDFVSKELSVHPQTLRNWERKKLIKPFRAGRIRIFTKEHIEKCKRIKEFTGKGISLKGIKELLEQIESTKVKSKEKV